VRSARTKFDAFWENSDKFFGWFERELKEGHGITIDVDDQSERAPVYLVKRNLDGMVGGEKWQRKKNACRF
jgi:hypothetical protein